MSGNEKANVWFYQTGPDGTQRLISSQQAQFEEIEFARTEPLPDPATLTVGDMIKVFTFLARTPPDWRKQPAIGQMLLRRDMLLSASPGWRVFEKWVQRKHGCAVSIEIAQAFRGELCRLLGKDFDEIEALPLLESVHRLDHPEATAPPVPDRPGWRVGIISEESDPALSSVSLAELIGLLDEFDSYPPPPPPGSRFGVSEFRGVIERGIRRGAVQGRIDQIEGIDQLRLMCYREHGRELDAPYVRRTMADLAFRRGLTLEDARTLTVAQAVEDVLASRGSEDSAGPPAPPREDKKSVAATASGTEAPPLDSDSRQSTLTPAARVLAAAYDLQREGKPISLRAACERAGNVDRGHLRAKYPEAVDAIRRMKTPDRTPRRGVRDRRTGDIDALDDFED